MELTRALRRGRHGGSVLAADVLDPLLLATSFVSAFTLFTSDPAGLIIQAALYVPLFIVAVDRAFIAARQRLFRTLWNILSLLYFPVLAMDLAASGELVHPIARLLFFLQLAKLYDRHTPRDRHQLVAVSFFQILAASVVTTEAVILIGLLAFLWLSLCLLMTQSVIKDGGETAHLPPVFRLSAWISAVVLVVSIAIFFLIPRLSAGFMQGLRTGAQTISGFSEKMDLDQSGTIKKDATIVLRARLLDRHGPLDEPLYWRGLAYTSYDGKRWIKSPTTHSPLRIADNRYSLGSPGGGARHRFELVVEPMDSEILFTVGHPLWVEGSFFWLLRDDNLSLYSRYQRALRVAYTVEAEFEDLPDEIPDEPLPSSRKLDAFLELPQGEERLVALAGEVTAGARTRYDACRRIQDYLRGNYGYTLDIRRDPSLSAVDDFLFNQRQGHCEFFATSMALLCRAAGIPARVVSGYIGGEFSETGDFYVIRQENAHAWVEAYFPGAGWLPFDPSPVEPEMSVVSRITGYWQSWKLLWDRYVLTYNFWDQFAVAMEVMTLVREARERLSSAVATLRFGGGGSAVPRVVVVILVLVAAGALLFWRGRARARPYGGSTPRPPSRGQQARAARAYLRFLREAARRGMIKGEAETPLEFAGRFEAGLHPCCEEIAELYYDSRFGTLNAALAEKRIASLTRAYAAHHEARW